ncbi:MAG: transketolase [Verrucomicrobia bacterium]|nr:transketolase [Verrucomicrobiota bacterium]
MNSEVLQKAADQARGLAIDAVHAAGIGHLGLPLGCAEIGAVLYGNALSYNPKQPRWINRDRFVLSAGHGSMFLYAWLHLSGYDLPMEQVKKFRQLHSMTPGHPEYAETPGVECTTGPLGQGVGNAVGIAISLKKCAERYNKSGYTIFDSHVICLAGDGCLQEGVAAEASSLAGHLGLDNLVLIYDSNDVTLDAQAEESQSEDTAKRYEAYGFDVMTIDGHDLSAVQKAVASAKANDNGKPKFIIAKTLIGKGIPEVAGTWKAHGEGGAKFGEGARKGLGLPEEHFYVSDEVYTYFRNHAQSLAQSYSAWEKTYQAWAASEPQLAAEIESAQQGKRPSAQELLDLIPVSAADAKPDATRNTGGAVLQPIAKALPTVTTGSADLFGSTKNYIKDVGDYSKGNPSGRNFRYGIREHAMGAVMNGIAYDGFWITSGATFLTFSDYMRPSIRLAALSKLPVFYIFTHDSVGVGEDGPTHQPVETTSALRTIPNLDVIRPGDVEETAAAFAAAIARTDGPTALILTRQNIPAISTVTAEKRRAGTLRGAYVAKAESSPLEAIILASGSELHVAMEAAAKAGSGVRVVSVPSFELFNRQDAAYKESVLPKSCRKRVAIEAGVSGLWYQYVGLDGKVVGIDRFGLSAPGSTVLKELGMTADTVVAALNS